MGIDFLRMNIGDRPDIGSSFVSRLLLTLNEINGVGAFFMLAQALDQSVPFHDEVEVPNKSVWNFSKIFELVDVASD